MSIYVDATTLIALGNVGELELLTNFDRRIVVVPAVAEEISTEPAKSNLERFTQSDCVSFRSENPFIEQWIGDAKQILGESVRNGDAEVIAGVLNGRSLAHSGDVPVGSRAAVVSDDRRVRTVAESLGATVTGTIGVVVRAVHEGMDPDEAKELVRRLDSQGLHMTGELREKAYRLVDEAAEKREDE